MRLHRLRLRNFRGVVDTTVAFSSEGVTIVEGPNEVGKTCIPEALDLVLGVLDSSKTKQVRSIKPVDRDKAPEVEIELSVGEYEFVYSKRWLSQPYTTLDISSPRREQLTGREAHDRVEAILAETLDSELWQALRIEQGADLSLPLFNVPSLGRALDLAAGGDTSGGHEDDLWDRISEERDRYWTATGQVKADRAKLAVGVAEAKDVVVGFESQLAEIESDAMEVERLGVEAIRLEATRHSSERNETELEERWELIETRRRDVEGLVAGRVAAEAHRDRVSGDLEHRRSLVVALADRSEALHRLEVESEQAAPALTAAVRRHDEHCEAVDRARAELRSAETELNRAIDDRDHHRRQIEVSQLVERHDRVKRAEDILGGAEAHLESASVDNKLVADIEAAHLEVVRAEAAAESGAASVEATALSDITVNVDGVDVALSAGATHSEVVTEEVELVVHDVMKIRVRAGSGSKDLGSELGGAREALDRLCAKGGVVDLVEAREASEARQAAERARDEARKTIEENLRDLTLDLLGDKIERLRERVESYIADRPVDPALPANFEGAKQVAADLDRLVIEHQEALAEAEVIVESAGKTRSEAELGEASLGGKIEIALSAKEHAEGLVAAARKERSDDELESALVKAERQLRDTGEMVQQAEEELKAEDPDTLELLLDNARDANRRAVDDHQANSNSRHELRIKLELRGEEGLHSRLGDATTRCRHLEREHERVEARARAAHLLHERFAQRRQEARQRYAEPFKQRIEQFGRIVFGPGFEIELDDDLQLVRRTLDGVTLDVDQLSVGAREQLGVLSRLACAAIVSPDGGGAPVVFDDALGWSDPARLERMGAAIASAGRGCLVIVLTCTPGRYAHVGNATVITLPN